MWFKQKPRYFRLFQNFVGSLASNGDFEDKRSKKSFQKNFVAHTN
jgi:hypothetical protein